MIAREAQGDVALVVPRVEVYRLCATVVVAAAAMVRWVGLAARRLQPAEIQQAAEAFSLSRGELEAYAGPPLVTNVQSLLFVLFSDSDLAARLPGLLAGTALVAVPLLVRGMDP